MEPSPIFVCLQCKKYLCSSPRRCYWCGQDVCSACGASVRVCPGCLTGAFFIETHDKDELLASVRLPCRRQGCFYSSTCPRLRRHEEECPHRVKLCPLRRRLGCPWQGESKNQLVRHCQRDHPERVISANCHMFQCFKFKERMGSGVKDHYYCFFDAFNEFFHVYQCFDYVESLIKLKVCFNGDRRRTNKFTFEICFADPFVDEDRLVFQAACQLVKDQEFYYVDFLKVPFSAFLRYCIGTHLFYKITINFA
ncbi:hypothetical protein TcasGA2_TC014617 [Tribolium castaneum]|uniref:Uncharacterized protein n=1 Tax=Tribolium castaneum TaxID=7070 RepID=D6WMY7_TRICA|nr:hypothetical protein TcasGA2_TC014617 [Tribolium castaneum]